MHRNSLLLPEDEAARVAAYLEPRPEVTVTDPAGVRDPLEFFCHEILAGSDPARPNADLHRVAETIATAAHYDMTSAFALWCQRMVLEYLAYAPDESPLRTSILPKVLTAETLGSTAMASAMAHYVSGSPIPIVAEHRQGRIVLRGRVFWASNLYPPDFVMVTAATDGEGGRPFIVAVPGDAPGLCIDPYPHLMALQGTGSSSLALQEVEVPLDWVVTEAFEPFIQRVRPPFLLLQCSFAQGLADRALMEARACLRGVKDVMRPDLEELEALSDRLVGQIRDALSDHGASISVRDLVKLRLDCAQLATAAVALEAKIVGGRAYVVTSPTARRMREAAFLPIQAPTEGQLRWELSLYE
jgi:alkylation response protein AidB-like acyl-CoA dehydrogenase